MEYLYALGILIGLVIVFRIFQFYVIRKLKKAAEKTETDIDDTFIEIIQSIKPPFYYFLAFYLATYYITISQVLKDVMEGVLVALITYQVVTASIILIDYVLHKKIAENDEGTGHAMGTIGKIIKVILWAMGLLFVLSNFGVNVTSLVAGLGIGGIAIAFALQNILEDLFSSFTIFFDKPFQVGDYIIVGGDKGTVKKIGIKTTRIKTSRGEELVISNKELTSARIQNFKKLEERRGVFNFGITYETPTKKIREIPKDLEKIINSIDGVRFDRAHFTKFDDSALNFEIVFYIQSSEYAKFADAQQEMNIRILEKFEEQGIEMAYPTRMVYTKHI